MICEQDTEILKILRHWNYFLAIEQDLAELSRFIEFSPENYNTYSIELAHLLMTSTSEVDVLLKDICVSDKKDKDMGIQDYRDFFQSAEEWDIMRKGFVHEIASLPRFNLHLAPWENWQAGKDKTPDWWTANNKVKHHRSSKFAEANLSNVLDSVGALFLANVYLIRPIGSMFALSGLLEKPKLFASEHDKMFGWRKIF